MDVQTRVEKTLRDAFSAIIQSARYGNWPRWVDPTQFQGDISGDTSGDTYTITQNRGLITKKPRCECGRPRWFDSTQFQVGVASLGDASGDTSDDISQVS